MLMDLVQIPKGCKNTTENKMWSSFQWSQVLPLSPNVPVNLHPHRTSKGKKCPIRESGI